MTKSRPRPRAARLGKRGALTSMQRSALQAAEFLKAMANETRLMLLCALVDGETSVSGLVRRLELPQSRVSQQLARLRRAGLVANRHVGAVSYYSIAAPGVPTIVDTLLQSCGRKHPSLAEH